MDFIINLADKIENQFNSYTDKMVVKQVFEAIVTELHQTELKCSICCLKILFPNYYNHLIKQHCNPIVNFIFYVLDDPRRIFYFQSML